MSITRRNALTAALSASVFGTGLLRANSIHAQRLSADPLSRENVLKDPAIPVSGNVNGDISIVEYFDYQCPYCKKVYPELSKVVNDDGNVRLIVKNWPIFGGISITAARLVMALQYQGKYIDAHEAIMTSSKRLTEQGLSELLMQTGVNLDRANIDLMAHAGEIDAALKRNDDQAKAFGFPGTPAFIIGTFRIPMVLDEGAFRQAISDARAATNR